MITALVALTAIGAAVVLIFVVGSAITAWRKVHAPSEPLE